MKLFGTDGVRGKANTVLTAELAYQLGRAAAFVLKRDGLPDKKRGTSRRSASITVSMAASISSGNFVPNGLKNLMPLS